MPQNGSNKTSCLKESGLSSTIDLCLNAIYEGYFKPQEESLSYLRRLFFSFSGSLIFLHVTLIETGFKTLEIWKLLPNRQLKATLPIQLPSNAILSDYDLLSFTLGLGILYALIFAIAIASGYSKHGAVRYFISGVILPAFTLIAVQPVSII